jgi:hypothetical protein
MNINAITQKEFDYIYQDALRYRWLRVQENNTDTIDVVLWDKEDDTSNFGIGLRLHHLDDAIDTELNK